MKTPEEIKRGLECCHSDELCECEACPYSIEGAETLGCDFLLGEDAIIYINQLEQDNAQKDERIRQLEREKEALLEESKHGGGCFTCKHKNTLMNEPPCDDCWRCNRWEWRGVEEDANES